MRKKQKFLLTADIGRLYYSGMGVKDLSRLYTKGEVSRLTGIDIRTIKYYVERNMITPTDKRTQGGKEYWLYSESDIVKIRQIALYRELGYSANEIKKILQAKDFDWGKVLDTQIDALKAKKRHLENTIFAAELMRYANDVENEQYRFDISDFDNNIDQFTASTLAVDDDNLAAQSVEKISADFATGLGYLEFQQHGQKIIDCISRLRRSMESSPDSDEVQQELSNILQYLAELSENTELSPNDLLFGLRLISNISMDRITDLIFSKEDSMVFLQKALRIYCDRTKGEKRNG